MRLALLDHRLGEILTERCCRDHSMAIGVFVPWERLPTLRPISMGNGDIYATTHNLLLQTILKVDNLCSATEAMLHRAPIFLYAFRERRDLPAVSASRIIKT